MCLRFFIWQNVFEGHLPSGTCIFQKPSDSDANRLSASYLVPPLAPSLSPRPSQGPCSLFRTLPPGHPFGSPLLSHCDSLQLCLDLCPWASVHTICLWRKSHVARQDRLAFHLHASPLPHPFLLSHLLYFSPKATILYFHPHHGVGDFSLHPTSRMTSSFGLGEGRMILSPDSMTH